MITTLLALTSFAAAADLDAVSEDCYDTATELQAAIANGSSDYDEQGQQNFLLNYFAMATTLSPLHSAVPHDPGTGVVGLEIAVIPPLGCDRRLVLNATKTEDTNNAPAAPRQRVSFAFGKVGAIVPYAGLGYVPPVTVFGTRNVIASGEAGFGVPSDSGFEWGLRYHFTLMKTIAEIATPFSSEDEPQLDFYMGSTFGVDLITGFALDSGLSPYLALGFTDASTFFYIGDDAVVGNNLSPYAGLTTSLGVQWTKDWLDLAAEFYAAPGAIYTGRLRASVRLGNGGYKTASAAPPKAAEPAPEEKSTATADGDVWSPS